MYALRYCLCSYVPNVDNDEEATDEWWVKITKIGLRKRRGFVPGPKKPAQNVNTGATGRSIFFILVSNNYWELGTKSCALRRGCEPVV